MLIGDARALEWRAGEQTPYHPSMVSASQTTLAFASDRVPFGQRLASVDRTGAHLQRQEAEAQGWVRLSPDGRRLARQRIVDGPENPDIWVDDLDRGTHLRISSAPTPDIYPVWSPDGNRLAYVTGNPPGRLGERVISIATADGSGVVETFGCPGDPDTYCEPTDWLGDRLFVTVHTARGGDIWSVAANKSHAAEPLLAEPYIERDGRVSPDGRWIAYVSDESGRPEVSVRSLVGSAKRIVLSPDGGNQPVWRKDGTELFFVDPEGRLRAVPASRTNTLDSKFGLPVVLPIPPIGFGHWGTQYRRLAGRSPHSFHAAQSGCAAQQRHRCSRLAILAEVSGVRLPRAHLIPHSRSASCRLDAEHQHARPARDTRSGSIQPTP